MNFAKGNHTYTIEKKEILKYWDIETIIETTPEQALQSAKSNAPTPRGNVSQGIRFHVPQWTCIPSAV